MFIEINETPLKKGDKIAGDLVILRDIRGRKRAEEKMMKKMEELEKLNKLMISRELKMVELKKRIRELKENLK